MSTFFVPPAITTGECAGGSRAEHATPARAATPCRRAWRTARSGTSTSPAATSLAPGEGRVYVVDKNGKLLRTLTGFSGPTGVAVGPDGAVYVSELLQGAPEEPRRPPRAPAPDALGAGPAVQGGGREPQLDPTTIGQIVKVAPDGTRTYAQVTMPSGLLFDGGTLYASAWSIAGGCR